MNECVGKILESCCSYGRRITMEAKNLHKHVRNLATLTESSSSEASCYIDLYNGVDKCLELLFGQKLLLEKKSPSCTAGYGLSHRKRKCMSQACYQYISKRNRRFRRKWFGPVFTASTDSIATNQSTHICIDST